MRGKRVLLVLAGAVLALTGITGPASAQPDPITALAGSGTVNDPWVPMREAHTTCESTTLFGNYYGGVHRDPIVVLPRGTWIGVRYITSDGRSADVLWHNHSQWGFMLRSCFAFD
ncbi:hypothetical protein IOD16_23245 [Saccharothrix sp. 6-C]|uniref:hypothetical protein n=1 Tax=Saccharothrix sp. 6-C TaxID=2781735 RepID=UPI0019179E1B|nr:hypothetical protein [Saccharothrix sp. 6-C]QQQ74130.1 hypothetical protein IOD16_23245 [Saccharothrix sp. 6-C]